MLLSAAGEGVLLFAEARRIGAGVLGCGQVVE